MAQTASEDDKPAEQSAQSSHLGAEKSDIVVGIDGSKGSCCALAWAMQEASITGQKVNAVYGWTYSWDLGPRPDDDDEEGWKAIRQEITRQLYGWAKIANEGINFDMSRLKLTSVRANGSEAILKIGAQSDQIVVGRRSLRPVARWFLGSVSSSIVENATVPVTIVRVPQYKENAVTENIHNVLSRDLNASPDASRPIVVGFDGTDGSRKAVEFAGRAAHFEKRPLRVLYCWQPKDLPDETGEAVLDEDDGQDIAQKHVDAWMETVNIPRDVPVRAHAFHITPGKGLVTAGADADRIVVGSRGLTGIEAHTMGSVSQYVVENSTSVVTVVH